MPTDTLIALFAFAALMVGTPGPANVVALGAGARFGLGGCRPLIAGLISGKVLVNLAMGFGLFTLLRSQPVLFEAARWASFLYMCWLAWRIAGGGINGGAVARPLGFRDGIIVHPLNPKAWAMSSGAFAQFADPSAPWAPQVLIVIAVFIACQAAFHSLWALAGVKVAAAVAGTRMERGLMIALGLATLATVIWAMTRGTGHV